MNMRILLAPIVVGALLAASGSVEAAPAPKQTKVTFIKGDVQAGVAPALARVKRGQALAPGTTLKTGENARAELTFPDGSVVRVGPQAELKIDGAAFDGKSKEVKVEATLVGGQAWAKVAKLVGDESQFNIKTNNAVAGVRGTVFRVNVDRDEATVVKVYNGAVAVAAPLIASSDASTGPTGPINPNRKPIAAPFSEVSKKDFEHILGKMMSIRIPKGASVSEAAPVTFTPEEDTQEEPEWVRWNSERDAGKSTEKSD